MRVVFFGTADFAVPALSAIAPSVILVVTQPDRPSGRGLKLKPSPVKVRAEELGIPVLTPESARSSAFIDHIQTLEADVHVVAAYGQILTTRLLESARRGSINLHGSILPEYRGAAPIQRCIMEGRAETGVTLMQMDRGMDTGDIIDIRRTTIDPADTYGDLAARLSIIAADQIASWLPKIVMGDYLRTPQNHEQATYAPKLTRDDRELRNCASAEQFVNHVRGLHPQPGGILCTKYGELKVTQATRLGLTDYHGVRQLDPLQIAYQGSVIQLDKVKPAGRPEMTGADWALGQRLSLDEEILELPSVTE